MDQSNQTEMLDVEAGISEQERAEIVTEIEGVVQQNKISLSDDMLTAQAQRSGVLLPVLVNVVAAAIIALGVILLTLSFATREEGLTIETEEFFTTEGQLIQEVLRESQRQLDEKEGEMSAIRDQLGDLEAQKADLEENLENRVAEREEQLRAELEAELAAERERLAEQGVSAADVEEQIRAFEEARRRELDAQIEGFRAEAERELNEQRARLAEAQRQLQDSLAGAEAERQRLLQEAEQQAAELQADFDREAEELRQASSEAQQRFQDLASRQERQQMVIDQISGAYGAIFSNLSAGNLDQAESGLATLERIVTSPTNQDFSDLMRRQTAELQMIATIRAMIAEERGRREAIESGAAARAISQGVIDTITEAQSLAGSGSFAAAETRLGAAFSAVPEIRIAAEALAAVRSEQERAARVQTVQQLLTTAAASGGTTTEGGDEAAVAALTQIVRAVAPDQAPRAQTLSDQLLVRLALIPELQTQGASQDATIQEVTDDLRRTTERLTAAENRVSSQTAAVAERDSRITALTNQVRERDGRVATLTTQVSERDTRIGTLTRQLTERAATIDGLNADKADQTQQIARLTREIADQNSVLATVRADVQSGTARIAALTTQLAERDEELVATETALTRQVEALNAQLNARVAQSTSLEGDLTATRAALRAGEQTLVDVRAQLTAAEAEIADLTASFDATVAELTAAENQIGELQRRLSAADALAAERAAAIRERERQIATLSTQSADLRAQLTDSQAALAAAEERARMNEAVLAAQREIAALEQQLTAATTNLEATANRLAAREREVTTLTSTRTTLEAQVRALTTRVTNLEGVGRTFVGARDRAVGLADGGSPTDALIQLTAAFRNGTGAELLPRFGELFDGWMEQALQQRATQSATAARTATLADVVQVTRYIVGTSPDAETWSTQIQADEQLAVVAQEIQTAVRLGGTGNESIMVPTRFVGSVSSVVGPTAVVDILVDLIPSEGDTVEFTRRDGSGEESPVGTGTVAGVVGRRVRVTLSAAGDLRSRDLAYVRAQ